MKLRKFITNNRFILHLFLTYCLIIVVGIFATSYFVSSNLTNKLIDTEARYEAEIIQKMQNFTEDKFKNIYKIFSQSYWEDTNISDLLKPSSNGLSKEEIDLRMNTIIQNVCWANDFVLDIMVFDYKNQKTYFATNGLYRDVSINYNFFNSKLVKTLSAGSNKLGIIQNYIPDYLIGETYNNNIPVMTVYINLYDINNINVSGKIGAIALNIDPQFFKNAYSNSSGSIRGDIMVMNESGYVFFDSRETYNGNRYPFDQFGWKNIADMQSNGNYVVEKRYSDSTGFYFVDVVNKKAILAESKNVQFSVFNIIAVCILVSVCVGAFSLQIFIRRVRRLVKHMKMVEIGGFSAEIAVTSNDEIGYIESSFNRMCRNLDEHIKTVYISELKLKSSELKSKNSEIKALQAQINPHFMFNTLESIRIMAKSNRNMETVKMIHILGELFRWNINMKNIIVTISDEMDYMQSYIELLKIRYDNNFNVIFNVDSAMLGLGIPKLCLQPILENSVYHGISSSDRGLIQIKGWVTDSKSMIQVTDNGAGMDKSRLEQVICNLDEKTDGDLYNIGLKNVHQRIRLLFGESYGLEIRSEHAKGTSVLLTLPAQMKEEMIASCTE